MGYGIKLRDGVYLQPDMVSGLIVSDGPAPENRRTIQLLVGASRLGPPAVVTLIETEPGQAEKMAHDLCLDFDPQSYWEWDRGDFDRRGVAPALRANEAEALRAAVAAQDKDKS